MVRAFSVQFLVFSLESHKKCTAYMLPQKYSTEQEQVTVISPHTYSSFYKKLQLVGLRKYF